MEVSSVSEGASIYLHYGLLNDNEVLFMNQIYRDEIDHVVEEIRNSGMVSKIILFGSLARGEDSADSDIDLCALTDITNRRTADITVELRRKLIGIKKLPLDLFTFRADDFKERAKSHSTFEHIIDSEGVVLYDRGTAI